MQSARSASAREAPPVPDKDSSVGATALEREDGFARRLPQNDSDLPDAVFLRIRYQPCLRTSSSLTSLGSLVTPSAPRFLPWPSPPLKYTAVPSLPTSMRVISPPPLPTAFWISSADLLPL